MEALAASIAEVESGDEKQRRLQSLVLQVLSAHASEPLEQEMLGTPLVDCGITSNTAPKILAQLAALLHVKVRPTLVFRHPTAAKIVDHLMALMAK